MSQLGYRILILALIVGPFVLSLIWVILSRSAIRKARKEQKNPGCFAISSQVFSIVILFLSICWGLIVWFLDAVMRSM